MKTLKAKTNWMTPLLRLTASENTEWGDYIAMTPEPLKGYLQACEVHCLAECCGVDAFEFSPKQGAWWAREVGEDAAAAARELLDRLIEDCSTVNGSIALYDAEVVLPQRGMIAWLREMREALNYIEVRPGDLHKIAD